MQIYCRPILRYVEQQKHRDLRYFDFEVPAPISLALPSQNRGLLGARSSDPVEDQREEKQRRQAAAPVSAMQSMDKVEEAIANYDSVVDGEKIVKAAVDASGSH